MKTETEIENYMESHNGYSLEVLRPCYEFAAAWSKSENSQIKRHFEIAALLIEAQNAGEKLTIKGLLEGPISTFCLNNATRPPAYSYFTRIVSMLKGDALTGGKIVGLVQSDMIDTGLVNTLASLVTVGRDGSIDIKPGLDGHLDRLQLAAVEHPVAKQMARQDVIAAVNRAKVTAKIEKENAPIVDGLTAAMNREGISDERKQVMAEELAAVKADTAAAVQAKISGKKSEKTSTYRVKAETAKRAMEFTGASDITRAVEILLLNK